jgi:prepilin-type N-terminal cleavage/methylation domain-containing protein
MFKQKGFSLIELLIVVAIILIIAAIAIPNMLRARIAANESAAIGNLRALNTAAVSYATAYPTVGYATTLVRMAGNCAGIVPSANNACLIDNGLAAATVPPGKSGYIFLYAGTTGTYITNANPVNPGSSGNKYFFTSEDGVVRVNSAAPASIIDPAI